MTVKTIEGENQFSNLEDRLANLSGYIETTIHEDGILLLYIDRVANHCKRALALMETHHNEAPKSGNENTDTGGTSIQEFESTASSTTDTTGSEKSIRASASMAALESQGSLSVLGNFFLATSLPMVRLDLNPLNRRQAHHHPRPNSFEPSRMLRNSKSVQFCPE